MSRSILLAGGFDGKVGKLGAYVGVAAERHEISTQIAPSETTRSDWQPKLCERSKQRDTGMVRGFWFKIICTRLQFNLEFAEPTMNFTLLLIVIGGCTLGLIQLGIGIAIGMWLRRGDSRESTDSSRGQEEIRQAGLIAQRLQVLADEMSSNIGAHRAHLDNASQALTSEDRPADESMTKIVTEVIDDIVRANQTLQSKLETAEARLQEQAAELQTHISQALTDSLTGLPNRRAFNERLEERMSAWKRRGEAFTLLLLDVDHFKKLNDKHGHLTGDEALKLIGQALRKVLRRDDSVARYGGEEFAMILPATTLEQSCHVAEKVRQAVAGVELNRGGERIAVTVSSGLATIQLNEQEDSLVQRADSALYAAKDGGRNCSYMHDGENCQPATGTPARAKTTASSQMNAACQPNTAPAQTTTELDTWSPREEISAELAKTCDELRQFVEDRDQSHRQAVVQSRA